MKVKVGNRDINLSNADFLTQGGQGKIYSKGGVIYKLYHQGFTIPLGKINELSRLDKPYIIRPLEPIYQGTNFVGYTMNEVKDAYALCQLFPKAFRQREGVTQDKILHLIKFLRDGVQFIHDKDVLIVDLNELNFLVDKNFKEVLFLDVDNYQTKNYKATALMESVRDRHNKSFSRETDWFSFGIVSFQMFVGIHPFKGQFDYPASIDKDKKMDYRMEHNISVLNPKVRVPASTLPFNIIPSAYMEWFKAVFEQGQRLAPPSDFMHTAVVITTKQAVESINFKIARFFESIEPKLKVSIVGGALNIERKDRKVLVNKVLAEGHFTHNNELYVKYEENIYHIGYKDLGGNKWFATQSLVNTVLPKASVVYDGIVIDNILGRYYALITDGKKSLKVSLNELDGAKIINAKRISNVLVLTAFKNGKYIKNIYRFDEHYQYDVRTESDISNVEVNFAVLDNGLLLNFADDDKLELMSSRKGSTNYKIVKDNNLSSSDILMSRDAQPLFMRGTEVYKFNMK